VRALLHDDQAMMLIGAAWSVHPDSIIIDRDANDTESIFVQGNVSALGLRVANDVAYALTHDL
jgi:hypothetical protein